MSTRILRGRPLPGSLRPKPGTKGTRRSSGTSRCPRRPRLTCPPARLLTWRLRPPSKQQPRHLPTQACLALCATDLARKHRKPCLHLSAEGTTDPVKELLAFIQSNGINVLNVAGSRASKEPGIGHFVKDVLSQVLV